MEPRVYANAEAVLHLDLAARRLQRLPERPDQRSPDVWSGVAARAFAVLRRTFQESVEVLLPHESSSPVSTSRLAAAYSFWRAHAQPPGTISAALDNAARAIEAATGG
jgi:hypothetical protein